MKKEIKKKERKTDKEENKEDKIEMKKERGIKAELRAETEKVERIKTKLLVVFIIGLILAFLLFIFTKNWIVSIVVFVFSFVLFFLYIYIKKAMKKAERIRNIESAFPDFLQLMSSNLRAGMTIDRAMLLSSRPEFSFLDKEILKAGKDIATGKSFEYALLDMSKRIGSKKIEKTIILINSGIMAGGNLAVLLEETASNMREREFVEKRAASNVLMYVIFIFIAVSFGAPLLFSLSSILVETLSNLLSGFPSVETAYSGMPLTLSGISISINFVLYFCLIFIIVIDLLASLVLGLVSKGDEKEGMRYLLPIVIISLAVFFLTRLLLSGLMSGLFR